MAGAMQSKPALFWTFFRGRPECLHSGSRPCMGSRQRRDSCEPPPLVEKSPLMGARRPLCPGVSGLTEQQQFPHW